MSELNCCLWQCRLGWGPRPMGVGVHMQLVRSASTATELTLAVLQGLTTKTPTGLRSWPNSNPVPVTMWRYGRLVRQETHQKMRVGAGLLSLCCVAFNRKGSNLRRGSCQVHLLKPAPSSSVQDQRRPNRLYFTSKSLLSTTRISSTSHGDLKHCTKAFFQLRLSKSRSLASHPATCIFPHGVFEITLEP